ncbi:DinB family protein [Paenibacillus sp. NFR01]|uniref:DinB family protein n=1 Tax=Paenibacillus sp. NFR01 TaxID=1566279 RepID=UPI0008B486F1|nr:DinB family protein [Paenibacillus sp. NFR01]SEU27852.1 Uncharacterized damage-inducible protein DinB (forms a four-helix bundle) [Paenibacillus sp. NFR01]
MIKLFEYNWQVRKEWLDWCETVSMAELMKKRTGGIGYFLPTLYHIIAVEYGWICGGILEKEIDIPDFDDVAGVQQIKEFSERCHAELAPFVYGWDDSMADRIMIDITDEGEREPHTYAEVLSHVIAHEIHHIGQLSVWAREIGKAPVSANVVGRGLFGDVYD